MFLYKNQEKANQIREQIEKMKQKIKQVNEELKNYRSYGNQANISLNQQITNVEGYLSKTDFQELGDMSLLSQEDMQKTLSVLRTFKALVHTKVEELQYQLKVLTK